MVLLSRVFGQSFANVLQAVFALFLPSMPGCFCQVIPSFPQNAQTQPFKPTALK
jgi:hypothetical protein